MADPLATLVPPLDLDRVRLGDAEATAAALLAIWTALNHYFQTRETTGRVGTLVNTRLTDETIIPISNNVVPVTATFTIDPVFSTLASLDLGEGCLLVVASFEGTLTITAGTCRQLLIPVPNGRTGAFGPTRRYTAFAMVLNNSTEAVGEAFLGSNGNTIAVRLLNDVAFVAGLTRIHFELVLPAS